ALAAHLGGSAHRRPAGLPELAPRLVEAVGDLHLSGLEAAALRVTHGIQRTGDLAREAVDLVEDHRALLLAPLGVWRLAEDVLDLEVLEEQEPEVAKIGFVAVDGLGHESSKYRRRRAFGAQKLGGRRRFRQGGIEYPFRRVQAGRAGSAGSRSRSAA